jgi:hypothetical protein
MDINQNPQTLRMGLIYSPHGIYPLYKAEPLPLGRGQEYLTLGRCPWTYSQCKIGFFYKKMLTAKFF